MVHRKAESNLMPDLRPHQIYGSEPAKMCIMFENGFENDLWLEKKKKKKNARVVSVG